MSYCTCEPLTEKLLSCLTTVKGFPSLLICFASIFCRVMTFIRYFGINFTYGLLDCVRYTEDFVISRFCFIHFTVTLAEMKNIVLYKLQCKCICGHTKSTCMQNSLREHLDQVGGAVVGCGIDAHKCTSNVPSFC